MIIDFINTFFLIALGALTFYLVVARDYFFMALEVGRAVFTLLICALVFSLQYKAYTRKIEYHEKNNALDDVAAYFSRSDIYKSLFLNILAVSSIIVLALINGVIDSLSVLYVMIVSVIIGFWHIALFKRKGDGVQMYYATYKQKINGKLIVFAIPLIMAILTVFKKDINLLRVLQILLVFGILYLRHYLIFRRR